MQDNAFTTYTCPHCGNPIALPQGLTEFSCMYCGTRMTLESLTAAVLPDEAESRQAMAVLTQELPACITNYPDTVKNLAPSKFQPYYQAYLAQHLPNLELVDSLRPDDQETLAASVVEQIENWIQANRKPLVPADALLEDTKFTLCLVTIPAIRQAAPEQGLAFSECLHRHWLQKYPKSNFRVTSYEEIAVGFKRKRLCFITTAVCRYLGKPDNCRELTVFRAFRDGYLRQQHDGEALIDLYYRIAPGIVTAIEFADDPDTVYPAIWQQYLQPCYDAICREDYALCKIIYTEMVQQLAAKYLATEIAA